MHFTTIGASSTALPGPPEFWEPVVILAIALITFYLIKTHI